MFEDPILKSLIQKYPAPKFENRSEFLFEDLIESIISQQLSVKASNTIYSRFKLLFKPAPKRQSKPNAILSISEGSQSTNRDSSPSVQNDTDKSIALAFPTFQQILEMPDATIRTAGISFQKISYIKNIATAFANNEIDIKKLNKSTDEEVIISLTKLKGVGKWTAEMTLIFTLNRPDVFSIGDLGLRNAVEKLYKASDQKKILKLSEKWKPHRSTASWYLWRSLENKT